MKKRRGRLGMTFATYLQKVYVNFAEVKRHLGITHKKAWGFCTRFALSLQRNLSITHKQAWGFCTRFALSLQRNIGITHKKAWGL